MRTGPFFLRLCLFLFVAAAPVSAETVKGVVGRYTRGPCKPGFCEWLAWDMQTEEYGRIEVRMQKRVIEGTVFPGHTIEVDGDYNRDARRLNADRITDLVTGATTGYKASNLKYPEGQSLSLTAVIDSIQPPEEPTPGMRQRAWRQRFVLLIRETKEKISAERVGANLAVSLFEQGDEVTVSGRWTERNVLRLTSITRTR